MEERYNEATHNRPEGDRPIDAPVVCIDIPAFVKQIKKEKTWDKNDRNAITVFKSDKLSIVLVAMRKKAVMKTERPENIFSLQVLDGRVKLTTDENSYDVRQDEMFVLHAGLPYSIEAVKKTIFLLTIGEESRLKI